MAKNYGMVVNVDTTSAGGALGSIDGMIAGIKTNRFTRSVIQYTWKRMTEEFDAELDARAITSTGRHNYHHVYEWRMIGLPAGRLWSHKLTGAGGHREATFSWKASKTKILTPEERRANATGISENDPIQFVPQKNIDMLNDRPYIFYWKAPVMEYDLPVMITPKDAEELFVPIMGGRNGFKMSMAESVMNPGGDATTGSFTFYWTYWWSTVAPNIFDNEIRNTVERDLGRTAEEQVGKHTKQRRTKTVSIGVASTDFDSAYVAGKRAAMSRIEAVSSLYDEYGASEQIWDGDEGFEYY
jgi:hypothetical protein